MNEKEIAEIRRRFHPEKSNITHVRGCYVNEKGEIISEMMQPLSVMPQEEAEKMLAILKRTLSGTMGKNLFDINFSTQQVVDGEEHKLLMTLRNSSLQDEAAVQAFYQQVIRSLSLEENYLILLAQDKYDVPYRAKDGEKLEDASSDVFSYILCSICPVKMTKPALSYSVVKNEFCSCTTDWIVAAPELGFLFPAFDDRAANVYGALYYSRDTQENHQAFVDAVFQSEIPMPAAAQKELFQAVLEETLAEDCSYEVVQAVHSRLCEMVETHKVNKEVEPLVISKHAVKSLLSSCGVDQTRVDAFEEKYTAEFGADTALSPRNIVDTKQFEVKTPDVSIRVNPDRCGLVQTRIIDGAKYIVIRADEGVEVNGVNVQIAEQA